MLVDIIGYAAGAILAVCFVPQVWKTWKTRSAEDVSFWMVLLTLVSAILYEIYAFMLGLWPVVVMNGIFAILVAIQLSLKLAYSAPDKANSP